MLAILVCTACAVCDGDNDQYFSIWRTGKCLARLGHAPQIIVSLSCGTSHHAIISTVQQLTAQPTQSFNFRPSRVKPGCHLHLHYFIYFRWTLHAYMCWCGIIIEGHFAIYIITLDSSYHLQIPACRINCLAVCAIDRLPACMLAFLYTNSCLPECMSACLPTCMLSLYW